MPTDQLITTAPSDAKGTSTVRAVLAVLAGNTVAETAAHAGLDAAVLADAVETFRQAGIRALADAEETGAAQNCWQVYLEFADWATAETTAAQQLRPLLHQAENDGNLAGWWFIRKHPCWRFRLHIQPGRQTENVIGDVLDQLTAAGHLTRWWPGIYEPETTAFGGGPAMTTAHRLFHTDSRAILDLATHGDAPLGRPEMSVLLITTLLNAAGLERYEQGHVWDHVSRERPLPTGITPEQTARTAKDLRHLLLADTSAGGPLFKPGSPLASTAAWADSFRRAGRDLGKNARAGTLERGLRLVLSYHVIFHWNRLGIAPRMQAALAHSARDAILGTRTGPVPPTRRTKAERTQPIHGHHGAADRPEMSNRFWQDDPDATSATLLRVVETYCHREAWEGAYEQLQALAGRTDDEEMRVFRRELVEAVRDPSAVPAGALREAAGYDDGSAEAFLARLWRDLFPEEPPGETFERTPDA